MSETPTPAAPDPDNPVPVPPALMPWPQDRIQAWHDAMPWIVGCNFLPSTAVNFTAMWSPEQWDPATIDAELGLAASLGMNAVRSNLQFVLWEEDAPAYRDRLDQFCALAARHGIRVVLCFFDDCCFSGKQPYTGPQDAPKPGVHNSGCTPSPGHERVVDRACWPRLESFVRGIIRHFAQDPRVLAWDLYNEPGNTSMGKQSLPLLEATFAWARAEAPSQPLTTGGWSYQDPTLADMARHSHAWSDLISFHCYGSLDEMERIVGDLQDRYQRPLWCTEWMARKFDSRVETHLPWLAARKIGAFQWGLVNGATQTHFPWGHKLEEGEPDEWFHDLFHRDHTPYREAEHAVYREQSARHQARAFDPVG